MQLIGVWLLAMVSHWQSWLSGGGFGGFILIIILLIEKMHPRGWTVPKRWYVVLVGAFFVLGASFMTWKDQYSQTQTALAAATAQQKQIDDLNKPQLSASIQNLYVGDLVIPNRPERKIIYAMIVVKNQGAPAAFTLEKISVHFRDGHSIDPPIWLSTGNDVKLVGAPGQPTMLLKASDYLESKAATNPVAREGILYGWTACVMPVGVSQEDILSAAITIYFTDVNDKPFTVSESSPFGVGLSNFFNPSAK